MGGYVTFVVAVFLIVIAVTTVSSNPQLFPDTTASPTTASQGKYCEAVNPVGAPTFKAPEDNVTKCGGTSSSDDDDKKKKSEKSSKNSRDRHEFGAETTYRLIRKNVPINQEHFAEDSPHSDTAENLGIQIPEIDASKYRVYFPEISGEIRLKNAVPSRTRSCRNGGESTLLYFIDYGLVFVVPLENGQPKIVQGKDNTGADNTFWLVDVYKDVNRPEVPAEGFSCGDQGSQADKTVMVPGQSPILKNNQLQLEYFLFNKGGVVDGWRDECKPAIYLYPKEKTLVNVKVSPKGILSYVDPPYDADKGWTVWANPDGQLSPINNEQLIINNYPYLYYESKIRDEVIKKPTKGFVVRFEELDTLYRDILPKLGLNQTQTKDFIEYWNKALPYSPYYFVGIMDKENVNFFEPLEITPKPDSINRVRLYFERLDSPKDIAPPELPTTNDQRLMTNDFKVVEWGGMVKKDKDHPFTCSQ